MLKVGVQLYSVRDVMDGQVAEKLQEIKDMGYDGVEFAGMYGMKPEELRDLCKKIGLEPISAHVPYFDMVKDPEGVLEQYRILGCKFVAVPYLTEECRPGQPGFAQVVENVKMLGKIAKEKGMTLLYHNHDFEFVKVEDGSYALDYLYNNVSADLLQTELDTCWVRVGGEDPAAYVRKYTGRAPIVHLKDYTGSKSEHMYELIGIAGDEKKEVVKNTFEFRPCGAGVQDIPGIVKAAEEAGAGWVIVEQDNPSMGLSSMASVRSAREYLKSIGC